VRIVSLLPSATEIVCALGAREELVGRSHECDFPAGLDDVPVLTSARIGPLPTSKGIDAAVRRVLEDALAIYEVDIEGLRGARPDVIVTQDLCDVCAVSADDVRAAVARLARQDVTIVNLHPTRLGDIWDDIERVARAIGRGDVADRVVAGLEARMKAVAERAGAMRTRPTVLSVEWIEPVMVGGMWMPELVTLAGGEPLVTKPGEHAPTLDLERLTALDPDVVIVKPCGFPLDRTLRELPVLRQVLPWDSWRATAQGRVYVADGNAYFNRPGPRIVESAEILAACIHPDAFPDLAANHAASVARIGSDARGESIVGRPVSGGPLNG
jgi:iron complex transport system substrate-binding protein